MDVDKIDILKVYSRNKKIDSKTYLIYIYIAQRRAGFSGADLQDRVDARVHLKTVTIEKINTTIDTSEIKVSK